MRHVISYAQRLFAHGLELYNEAERQTATKGVLNAGGAKVFNQPFKANNARVHFNNRILLQVFSAFNVVLYTLNRIELDDQGQPKRIKGTSNYDRVDTGLLAFNPEGGADAGRKLRDRLIEALAPTVSNEGIDIADYIEVVKNIPDPQGHIGEAMKGITYRNFVQAMVPVRPESCVILALPSGQQGSQAMWTLLGTTSRPVAAGATGNMEDGDMPI